MELHHQKYEKELALKASLARVEAYLAYRRAQLGLPKNSVALAEYTLGSKELQLDAIQLDELEPTTPKLDYSLGEVQDPLREVNLGDESEHKPTFISQLLEPEFQTKLIKLLREYRDFFAWDCD